MNSNAIIAGIEKVTKKWCKQKKAEERHTKARWNRRFALTRSRKVTVKDAAWQVMERAYLKASSSNTLPAHARQIMYAARGEILRLTGEERLADTYFTQKLLPDYINEHPEAQAWDVVYDARGHFEGPHTPVDSVSLGTLDVRRYIQDIESLIVEPVEARVTGRGRYPTYGPDDRFGAVLFIEKEGFLPLFERVKLAQRYDLAIMSTKGMSNVAARTLIDHVCGRHDIPLLALHDFDVAGFMILGTLSSDTRRYEFEHDINVIDLGLRLKDVEEFELESEPVQSKRLDRKLEQYGATKQEIAFLASQRVEINAFSSADLIKWLEGKLEAHGIRKVIPHGDIQADAFGRSIEADNLRRLIEAAAPDARRRARDVPIPKDLDQQIRRMLEKNPAMTWDAAVMDIARKALEPQDN